MAFARAYWQSIEPGTFLWRLVTLQTLWIPQSFKQNHWPFVNTAVWTIQYEFLCYLLVMVLGVIGTFKRRWFVMGLFAAAYAWHMLHLYRDMWVYDWKELPVGGSPDYYPRFVTYFLAGCVCLAFGNRARFGWKSGVAAFIITAVFAAWGKYLDAVLPVTLPVMVFALAFSPRLGFSNWGKYGDFSYGLYIFAWPVQQILIHLTGGKIGPITLFVSAFAITLLFAVASWYCVERPFLRMKPKRKVPPAVSEEAASVKVPEAATPV
jgi:peptidoglycan/LPS O-acetylase OafA/YrhL